MRSDGGSEFRGSFAATCEVYRIRHVRTAPHSPWQNGRAERMIRTSKALLRRLYIVNPQLDWVQALHQV